MKIALAILGCISFVVGCLACIRGQIGIEILYLAIWLQCAVILNGRDAE
jgi:hypothetical protein